MVNRLAVLGMVVDPSGAIRGSRRAHSAIAGVGRTAANVKNRIFSLQGALVALGGGVVARSFLKTATSMENLRVQLKTVTGSVNEADKAFARLTDFTTRTPYEIDQVVSAFTKLRAFGLDPSEEAMTAFGNTAAAMGKDLNQMIEAVADAATGEFERLKEFGIKSKKEGENVSFTFQGMTTTIKANSEEIQGYLMDIGNNQFGGAMSDQMKTMSGAISNLKGNWTLFQDELMNNGPFDIFKGLVNSVSDSLFGPGSNSLSSNAAAAGQSITSFIKRATLGVARFSDKIGVYVRAIWGSVSDLWNEFLKLPPEVQSIGIVGVMLGGFKLKAFMIGVLSSINTVKGLLGMSNIDNAMLNDMELMNAEMDKLQNSLAFLSDRGGMQSPLAEDLRSQIQELMDAKIALENTGKLDVAGPKLSPMGIPSQQLSITSDMGSSETALVQFYNDIDEQNAYIKKEAALTNLIKNQDTSDSEAEAAKIRRESFSGNMGEISAMHRNSQAEMHSITQAFEDRNSELHAAAMARKSDSFNVFKQSFLTGYEEMSAAAIPAMEQMGAKVAEIFGPGGTFSRGIGDATANMLVFGKSGKDSMKELGQTIIHQVVSGFIAMGVQQAVNWAAGKMFSTAGTALSVSQAAVTAAAWAPAAAAVSLASFGTNSVPASAGMASTYALASGLSMASFDGGGYTGSGSRSGGMDGKGGFPAILHPQETVTDHTKGQRSSGSQANITFNINAIDTSDATRLIMSQRGTIVSLVNEAMNERGRSDFI